MIPHAYPGIFSMKIFTKGNKKGHQGGARTPHILNKKMNNSGMLLVEETLKMIIAVIAIGFLVVFLVSLYFTKVSGNELNQANANIELIRKTVLNPPQDAISLNNPVGWNLFYFSKENSPNACANENCLCICDELTLDFDIPFYGSKDERQFNECNEKGACLGIFGLQNFESIEIKKLTKILIKKSEGKIEVSER